MDRILPLFSLLLLSAAASHAALPAQVYWDTVLPKTPMPSAIRELLRLDALVDEKAGTAVSVGKRGVNVNNVKSKPDGTNVNVGHGGVNVNNGHMAKPVVVIAVSSPNVNYGYGSTDIQMHNDPRVGLYFLEKDLHPGAKMTLPFKATTPRGAAFLPRKAAESLPFSSKKLPEILDHFSIEPNSVKAEVIKQTLEDCEKSPNKGERRYCATSLESMVDFTTSSLGTRDVHAMSTTGRKDGEREQQYTVGPLGVRRLAGSELVACHSMAYTYAVFYCHTMRTTRTYTVELVGKNGAAVEAVAVCHTDTAAWNPEHLAFKVLKVKPGAVPVCHFLPQEDIMWAPSK